MTTTTTTTHQQRPHVVFITGASSGIGRSLSLSYASKYSTTYKKPLTLLLTARRLPQLESLKTEIESLYPTIKVHIASLDVTDYKMVFTVFNQMKKLVDGGIVDVVVANSGVSDGNKVAGSWEVFEMHRRCVETNVVGLMATVNVALEHFLEVGKGQIVGIGSVAASRGSPYIAAYAASKAAVHTYLEGIRDEVAGKNITVTTIHPGFIDTEINRELKSRPFVISGEKGGEIILNRIERKFNVATVPFWPWKIVSIIMAWIPGWIMLKTMKDSI
ncbi:hypothetical protein HDU76_001351 [Blyttiomyces sp. JEL0837]|nr:hypothetical protein HDU76_001351 [Blyttiomyces sp. JEL0837]